MSILDDFEKPRFTFNGTSNASIFYNFSLSTISAHGNDALAEVRERLWLQLIKRKNITWKFVFRHCERVFLYYWQLNLHFQLLLNKHTNCRIILIKFKSNNLDFKAQGGHYSALLIYCQQVH